jgi:protoporphyrinogen/coproporphyrinogen III oxidase
VHWGHGAPPVGTTCPTGVPARGVSSRRPSHHARVLRGPMRTSQPPSLDQPATHPDGRPRVAVIGAGISGLVAARQLAAAGAQVVVFEQAARVGGQLHGTAVAGHHVDVGAESFFTAARAPLELIDELGLRDQLVPAVSGASWIWTDQGLRPLPEGFTPAGPTRLGPVLRSRVLSVKGIARAGLEPFVPASHGDEDVSVGHYLERRFGRELTDRLVDPLLGGLHAGDVRRLSLHAAAPQLAALARTHRSLLLRRRAAPRPGPAFVTLRGGMSQLTERLAAVTSGIEFRLDTRVTRVARAGRHLTVSLRDGAGWAGQGVVLATPAHVAAQLLRDGSPAAGAELSSLRAASVVVTALAYPAAANELPAIARGTGILVPSSQGRLLKAATFLSTKWSHHAADDLVLIRASAGRAGDDRAIELDDATLVGQLHRELAEATGLAVAPIDARVQRWSSTMPQLEVGHHERLAEITGALARDLPGVALAGAPYHGPGLASCLRSAAAATTALLASLEEVPA